MEGFQRGLHVAMRGREQSAAPGCCSDRGGSARAHRALLKDGERRSRFVELPERDKCLDIVCEEAHFARFADARRARLGDDDSKVSVSLRRRADRERQVPERPGSDFPDEHGVRLLGKLERLFG
jgi:hypothetical protein